MSRFPQFQLGQRVILHNEDVANILQTRLTIIQDMANNSRKVHMESVFNVGTVIARAHDVQDSTPWSYVVLPDNPFLWPTIPSPLYDYVRPAPTPTLDSTVTDTISRLAANPQVPLTNTTQAPHEPLAYGFPVVTEGDLVAANHLAPRDDPHRTVANNYEPRQWAMFSRRPTREEIELDPYISAMVPACFPTRVFEFDPVTLTIKPAKLPGFEFPVWQLMGPPPPSALSSFSIGQFETTHVELYAYDTYWSSPLISDSIPVSKLDREDYLRTFKAITPAIHQHLDKDHGQKLDQSLDKNFNQECNIYWQFFVTHGLVEELYQFTQSQLTPTISAYSPQLILPPKNTLE